ncbi:MAG: glutathione peroxidase [Paraglaciecola sp.]
MKISDHTISIKLESIHQFKIAGIDGKGINFADFKGKKVMIVNVASECGYTPQYEQMQELYERFQDKLVIVGFPANNFGGQEPGTHDQIQSFCTKNYGVTFPLTAKIDIQTEPIYQWLAQKSQNGVLSSEVKWNFSKYLLNENGELVSFFPSGVSPIDDVIVKYISK